MAEIEKIFVVCCPRSGGTYTAKWLSATLQTEVEKLSEASPYHPVNSDWGLVELCKSSNVLLVYVSRSDAGIMNSFRAARYADQNGLKEKIPSPMPDVHGIATTSNSRIWQMIEMTKYSIAKQLQDVRMISIQYEMLNREDTVWRFEENLEKAGIELKPDGIMSWHKEHWKKKPVRGGALSYGIKVSDYD